MLECDHHDAGSAAQKQRLGHQNWTQFLTSSIDKEYFYSSKTVRSCLEEKYLQNTFRTIQRTGMLETFYEESNILALISL